MTVGREAELRALASFVDALGDGPVALLLEGEPGIGKTTLWNEGVELSRGRGYRVLACRPSGSDAELSLVGLGDLLREVPDDVVAALPGPQAEALMVSLLRRPAGPRRPDPRAVSTATLGVLEALAADAPVVVAIDDVQWLDGATVRVFAFVVRRLSDVPVGFLLGRSDVDAPFPLGIGDALTSNRRPRVLVGPVTAEDLATMVRQRVGSVLSVSDARRLREVSGGNPFFALEIAEATARGDQGVTGQSLPIPRSLREDLVLQRLVAIPGPSVDLLLIVAAAGRPTLELLRLAGGGAAVRTRLQHAIDAGLVQVAGSEVRFSHPLYRSAIYAQASRARRHAVHRRLADLTSDPEGRARHLALSADAPDETVATSLEEAANLARDRGAPAAAAELLEHAIRLTTATSIGSVRRRHLAAADHRLVAGDTDDAEAHAREALGLSAPGSERADALRRVAAIELERGAIGSARRSLEDAESEAGSQLPVSAEVRRDLAELALRSGNLLDAERYARSVAEWAEATDDTESRAAAWVTVLRIGLLRGEARDVLSTFAGDDTARTPAAALVLADAEILTAEHERARARLEGLRSDALARGDEPGRRAVLARLAELELRDGSWDRAEMYALDARVLADRLGLGPGVEAALLAYLFALRGRVDEARTDADVGLRQGIDNRRALLWTLSALGLLELSLGHAEIALRHLGRAGGIGTEMGLGEPAAFPFLSDEAEALVAAGEHGVSDRRIGWLQERGETLGRPSALAAAARCRGLLLAETGELDEGLVQAERAVEIYAALPLPFERARSLLTLGMLRRRARQKRASREALEVAAERFDELGATIWANRARQELTRIGGRRASVTELTDGEDRVARLAAAGLTNREIARALSMSVRTVEGHLSHAYAKLGLRSRTELAVFFERPE